MSSILQENKKSGGGSDSIISWVDHVLFDEIKQFSTTKKALWSLEYRRYTFLVSPLLTKSLIKLAVEQFFNVRVLKVNTSSLKIKKKRVGNSIGTRIKLKKAIITLDPSYEISLFSEI
jgi:large subunit ribosomal protein L23